MPSIINNVIELSPFLIMIIFFILINVYIVISPEKYLKYMRKINYQVKEPPSHLLKIDIQTAKKVQYAIWSSFFLC
jgi:hypothetical protein